MTNNINNTNSVIPSLNIGCYNCNGLGCNTKRGRVLKWLEDKEEEILFLQETHSSPNNEEAWKRDWNGHIVFNHGSSNSAGVAILLKRNVEDTVKVVNHVSIVPGRASLLEVQVSGTVFTLVNVYCPNNDDDEFLQKVLMEATTYTNTDNLIFGGDWNTVMDNLLDKRGGASKHSNSKCQSLLNNFIAEWGLSHIFRLQYGSRQLFTHVDKQHKTQTRLDFFLVDDRLVNFPVCQTNISHGFKSDHSYVSLKIQGHTISHGRGYWKFNNCHLKSEDFAQNVRDIIRETVGSSFDSYNGLWDTIKYKIKDYSIYYGKKVKKYKTTEK